MRPGPYRPRPVVEGTGRLPIQPTHCDSSRRGPSWNCSTLWTQSRWHGWCFVSSLDEHHRATEGVGRRREVVGDACGVGCRRGSSLLPIAASSVLFTLGNTQSRDGSSIWLGFQSLACMVGARCLWPGPAAAFPAEGGLRPIPASFARAAAFRPTPIASAPRAARFAHCSLPVSEALRTRLGDPAASEAYRARPHPIWPH